MRSLNDPLALALLASALREAASLSAPLSRQMRTARADTGALGVATARVAQPHDPASASGRGTCSVASGAVRVRCLIDFRFSQGMSQTLSAAYGKPLMP